MSIPDSTPVDPSSGAETPAASDANASARRSGPFSLIRRSARTAGVFIPLVILWVVLSIVSPVFLSAINIRNLLLQASIVGILALGSTIVLITEEIDLSIGAVEGFAAVMAAEVTIQMGAPWWVGVLAALGSGVGVGLLNGIITVVVGVPSFITTLGTLGLVTGFSQKISNGETMTGFPSQYQTIGQKEVIWGFRLPVLFAIIVLAVLYFVLRQTRLGLNFYAVGGNRRAAALAGIRAGRVKVIALCISGLCAAIGGVLISARLDAAASTFGSSDLLNAIAAVVIGGTVLTGGVGSVIGTAAGVLIIVTIQNGLILLNVSPLWTQAFVGGIILAAVVIHRLTSWQSTE
jgi:ribose transport system permease protein